MSTNSAMPRISSSMGMATILLLAGATLLNYVDRGSLAIAAPLLQDELHLSSSQIGILLSAFFWTYAPSQVLAGWLVHRFDVRYVLAAGVALWSVATAITGLAGEFASLLIMRLLLGLGEAVTFPGSQLLLARHTAHDQRGMANGLIGAGQGLGPMLGTLFGGLTMAFFGWRWMFVGLGIITLLWVWPWLVTTRRAAFETAEGLDSQQIPYSAILQQRSFWGAALGHFCANYAFYFLITWLPTFLVKAGGLSVAQMATVGATIYGVYAASTALVGAASDRLIRNGFSPTLVRKGFALTGALGSAITILGSAYIDPHHAAWLLGLSGIFAGFTTPMIFTIATTLAGSRAAGRWVGAQNLSGQCAGILAPLITGFMLQVTGNFSGAFIVSAAIALLGMVGWGLLIQKIEPVSWPASMVATGA